MSTRRHAARPAYRRRRAGLRHGRGAGRLRRPARVGPGRGDRVRGRAADEPPAIFIDPKPPAAGGAARPRSSTDFLEAMTATPISTNVARQFLTRDAERGVGPGGADDHLRRARRGRAAPDMRDGAADRRRPARRARRLARPAAAATSGRSSSRWRSRTASGGSPRRRTRWSCPESWFEQRFRQVSLYFFDPTAQILVPEPVFVQRGEQSTTALTEALLRGPGAELDGVVQQLHPARPRLRPVGAGLRGRRRRHRAARLRRPADARGQRADDGPARLDAAAGARRSRRSGSRSAASRCTSRQRSEPVRRRRALGVRPGRPRVQPALLRPATTACSCPGSPTRWPPVDGPMGSGELGVALVRRSTSTATTVAARQRGRRRGARSPRSPAREQRVEEVVSGARATCCAPAWDFADRLWLVDAPRRRRRGRPTCDGRGPRELRGARVSTGDGDRVPGLARRLPAGRRRARPPGDQLMVSRMQPQRPGRDRRRDPGPADRLGGRERACRSATSPGPRRPRSRCCTAWPARLSEVRTISVDGSPSGADDLLTQLSGPVRSLAGSPAPGESLYAVTGAVLDDLSRGDSDVASTVDRSVRRAGRRSATASSYVG